MLKQTSTEAFDEWLDVLRLELATKDSLIEELRKEIEVNV